jgi:hypothetical protein
MGWQALAVAQYARRAGRTAAVVALIVVSAGACGPPPTVTPVIPALRSAMPQVSAEVRGQQQANVGGIGARGGSEGANRGAAGVAAAGCYGVGCLGLPVALAVGAIVGASAAHTPEQVDAARGALKSALEETDIGALLRQSLARNAQAGATRIAVAGDSASNAPTMSTSGHVLAIEYGATYMVHGNVSPDVQVWVLARGQLLAPGRGAVLHTSTWLYCSPKVGFIDMAANNGARVRAELARAARELGAAIPYDLFVSGRPRDAGCMNFSDVPGIGSKAP